MGRLIAGVGRLANPGTYKTAYANFNQQLHADIRKGSIQPLFKFMLLVGCTGYWMEWYMKGSTC